MKLCMKPREEIEVEVIIPVGTDGAPALDDATDKTHGIRWWAALFWGAGVLLGSIAAANAVIAARTPPPQLELEGAFNRYPARHGDVAYTVGGSGSPVLLLHDASIGGSMAEWENNFSALARKHTVYAIDFLGWGLSDKPPHSYTAEDCIEQIRYFAEHIIKEPCAVIASGRSGVFALAAISQAPEQFSDVVLVCPSASPPDDELHRARERLLPLMGLPLLGSTALNWLTSRAKLEDSLRRYFFFDKDMVDNTLVSRLHAAAHQPGARHAIAALLAGALDADWREPWSRLQLPALLIWGRNTLDQGLETAPEWLALAPQARLEVMDKSMLRPHVEQAEKWNQLVLDWLAGNK